MSIVKNIKIIDTKCRVILPKEWGKSGEKVYFEISKAGNLIVRKVNDNDEQER